MKKSDKPIFVSKLAKDITEAKSIVVVNYNGLSVKLQQDLKKRLHKVNGKMVVIKNTLFKRAGEEAKLPKETLEDSVLSGPTAFVFAKEDPIAPLQVIHKFAKESNLPELKVGVIEGSFQDKVNLEKLATLPSKDVLLSQTLGAIAAPLYGIVGTLNSNMQKLVYILKQKATQ